VLVEEGVVEVAVLDPEEALGRAAVGVFGVDAGHGAVELDADDLVAALVHQVDADAVLGVVLAVNDGSSAFAVGGDGDGFRGGSLAAGAEFLVPHVAAPEKDAVAGDVAGRGAPEGLPGAVGAGRGGVAARPVVVAEGLADIERGWRGALRLRLAGRGHDRPTSGHQDNQFFRRYWSHGLIL